MIKAYISAELRWWGKGYLPQALVLQCQQLPYSDQPPRLDFYLQQQTTLSSTKWRSDALEIKSMVCDPMDLPGKAVVYGPVTCWEKWRLPATLSIEGDYWLPIHKYRSVALYTSEGKWIPQTPDQTIAAGCLLEWTRVEYNGKTYWTIGLEGFADGSVTAAKEQLLACWDSLFDRLPMLTSVIGTSDRLDYPAWLVRVR